MEKRSLTLTEISLNMHIKLHLTIYIQASHSLQGERGDPGANVSLSENIIMYLKLHNSVLCPFTG